MSDRRFFRHAFPYLVGVLVPLVLVHPAQALSMKECSVKFKAAQDAGEAEGLSWSEFRKAQCAGPVDSPTAEDSAKAAQSAKKQAKAGEDKPKTADAVPKSISGKTTFPASIATKFAGEKPAKARMHTCLEQYHANKGKGTLGGMRWIEKGGGYYKLCNARLKGDG